MASVEGAASQHVEDLASQLAALALEPLPLVDVGRTWERLDALAQLAEFATAQPTLLTYLRRRVVDVLYRVRDWSRRDVLTLLGINQLLVEPLVPADWTLRMVFSVLSVCHAWNWI